MRVRNLPLSGLPLKSEIFLDKELKLVDGYLEIPVLNRLVGGM